MAEAHARRPRATLKREEAGYGRGLWPSLAAPGVLWLVLLFLVPFYAILAVAMGRLDPVFLSAAPVWSPLEWDPTTLRSVVAGILTGGPLQTVLVRTFLYVGVAVALCSVVGYPVAYYISRYGGAARRSCSCCSSRPSGSATSCGCWRG